MLKNRHVRILLGIIFGLLFVLASTTANSGTVLTGNYEVVSSVLDETTGMHTVSLAITVSNTSKQDLNTVNLGVMQELIDPPADATVITPDATALETVLTIANIPAGAEQVVSSTFASPVPGNQLGSDWPLLFQGNALDNLGQWVEVILVSNSAASL